MSHPLDDGCWIFTPIHTLQVLRDVRELLTGEVILTYRKKKDVDEVTYSDKHINTIRLLDSLVHEIEEFNPTLAKKS